MQPEIIKFLPVGGSVMRSTQYSAGVLLPTWQYPLAAANIHGISEHQHNVTINSICLMAEADAVGGQMQSDPGQEGAD